METGSYNNVSSQFKSVLDKSAKDHNIDNGEIKKLINSVKTDDDRVIIKKIVSGDIGDKLNIFQDNNISEYTFSVDNKDYKLNENNEIVNKNEDQNENDLIQKNDSIEKKPVKKLLDKEPKINIENEINKIIPENQKEKWNSINKKDKAAVKVFIDNLTIPAADKIKLQDLIIKSGKPLLDTDKLKKIIENQDRSIPLDKLRSIPAVSKYVINEFTGVNVNDIKMTPVITKIIGDGKVNDALLKVDQEVVSKVRDADIDASKSENKITLKNNSQGVLAGYQKNGEGGTVSTNLKNEASIQSNISATKAFGVTGNIGNVSSLADSTPANITKFKDIAKTLLIPEKTALKLHDDLISAPNEKEKLKVIDTFVKVNGSKGYAFVKSLGWIDKSVNLNVTLDGKASVLEISRQSILAGFEVAGTGARAGYNKQTKTVILKGTMAGREVEFEVSRENFRTAFGNSKNHAALEFNKAKFNLDLKGLGQTIQLKIEKGDYRVGGGVGSYEYSLSYKNKHNIETSQFEDDKTCQIYNIIVLNTEKGMGATATLPTGFADIKAGADREKNLYIKIMTPTLEYGKEMTTAEKERVTAIGKQIEQEKTLNIKTIEELEKGEKIIVNGVKKFDVKIGVNISGVNLKNQLDKGKDYKMTVESLGDCKVKVSLEVGADTKESGEIGASGNTLSGSREHDMDKTMEFECNLNTEKGREDYEKVLAEINLCTIPEVSELTPETRQTVAHGDETALIKKRGLSITVAAFTRTQELKISHNPDGTTTITSDRTKKQEDKNIPIIKNIIDDETKTTHGAGTIASNNNLKSILITMELKDSRVRKHEVIKYGKQAGQPYPAFSDLKDEKASIKVNLELDHQKLMKLWNAANKFVPENTESIPLYEYNLKDMAEIEGGSDKIFFDPNMGAFDEYADDTNGISKNEAENFRKGLGNSVTDEERLKTVLDFTRKNGESGFQFLQAIKDTDGNKIVPVSIPEITGSKLQRLNKDLAEVFKKLASLPEDSKHHHKEIKKVLSSLKDIKNEGEAQKDYLKSLKNSIDDQEKILPSDKVKFKELVDQSINKIEYIINKSEDQIIYLKLIRETPETEKPKSIEEIENG